MHLIHGHKKHQSRVESSVGTVSPPVAVDNSADNRKSAKPMKSRIKSFWRRHSSGKQHAQSDNRQTSAEEPGCAVSPPTSPLSFCSAEEIAFGSPADRTLTPSGTASPIFFPPGGAFEADSVFTNTSTARLSLRSSGGKSVSSSLKQAMLIAGGLVDSNGVCSPPDARQVETAKYQRPGLTTALPRIPEHAAACSGYTAAQYERLTAAVPRRQNAPANRNECFSAPPGIYWPDIGLSTIPEGSTYDRSNGAATNVALSPPPSAPAVSSPLHRTASPRLAKTEQAEFYRLPRFSLLSRSCRQSSDRRLLASPCAPKSVSPPPRMSTAFSRRSSSPLVPSSHSPIALLHRPLPPPPTSETALSTSRSLHTEALRVDFPSDGGSQVWQAVPMPNSQFDFEVVDTIVYSNVHVPVLRVASPPPATADLSTTTFPGGSPSRMSQTESEAAKPQPPPPPPPHSPSCQDRPVPQRQHISPVDRRKLSPRSRTAQNMATAIAGGGGSSQNYTNCPQGNTIISHHPASPFAPLPRVSPGGQTSPPAVSSRIDPCCQQHSQSQRCCCCACCSELVLSTAAGLCSRSPTEPCVCSQHAKGSVGGGHLPASSPSSRSNNVGPDDDVGNNTRTNTVSSAHCPRTVQPVTSRQDSAAGHRKEISATYEEAWDLKMARRLPGVDVTRLVSVSPAAVTAIMPGISGGVRSISLTTTLGALEAAAAAAATAAETRKSLSPAPPAQFTAGGAFRASERLIRHNGVGSRLLLTAGADSQQQPQPQDDSVVGCAAAAAATALRTSASSSRSSFCSHSPSPLLPVLTSTEETTVVPRRVNKGQRQCSYRNSSTDASFGRDAAPAAHCHRKHSADVKVPSPHPSRMSPGLEELRVKAVGAGAGRGADYDYAYNRSWSMGVQLSLSMNLDQEADASSGNGPTPTENTTRRLPPDQQKGPQRGADRPLSSTDAAASPVPTPEPALSANGGTCTGPGSTQPSSHHHQRRIRSPRDNHNLLASGVLSYPADASVGAAAASSGHQSPAPPPPPATTTQPSQAEEGGVEAAGGNNTALLPPMSRLLTDFDSLSTDSYEEAWDLRHGRVISQLTSTRFIDPEEVLSEVINSGRQGIGFLGIGGSNCHQQQQQPETADQMSQLKSGAGAGDCAVSSPPTSCQSSLACHRNAPAYAPTAQELKPLHEQTWFHPNLSRSDAETCLRSEPEGSFLVRNSETNKNDFSLTIKHNGFLHMKISRNIHGKFILGEYSQPYSSIPEMISHYERTRVPVRGADSVVLCHPR